MKKTWMPKTAGILDVVAGSLSFIVLFFLVLGIMIFGSIAGSPRLNLGIPASNFFLICLIAIPFFIAEVLAIIGGIYAIQRKKWGMALTGSIASIFCSTILGIAALVLTILSKEEFE